MLASVRECYASLFTDRAIFYRVHKEFVHLDVALSAIVQMMCNSESSGVMFTMDPTTGDESIVVIEAAYGLGEYVVKGSVTPDCYYVDKGTLKIIRKTIADKTIMLIQRPDGGTDEKPVPEALRERQVIPDDKVLQLAKAGLAIEEHYRQPMDIEWGLDNQTGKLLILQARPETVWSLKKSPVEQKQALVTERKNPVERVASVTRNRRGQSTFHTHLGPSERVPTWRDFGHTNDCPGLGSSHEKGEGHRNRQWRNDLPRSNSEQRAGNTVHRSNQERDKNYDIWNGRDGRREKWSCLCWNHPRGYKSTHATKYTHERIRIG